MKEFFEDSMIRGLATRVQQWGPSNVASQGELDTRSMAMGALVTKGLVMGPMTERPDDRGPGDRCCGGPRISLYVPAPACPLISPKVDCAIIHFLLGEFKRIWYFVLPLPTAPHPYQP